MLDRAARRAALLFPPIRRLKQQRDDALAEVARLRGAVERFAYHVPLDYDAVTLPPKFEPPVRVSGEDLPLPPAPERHGHSETDETYLAWGKSDHDLIMGILHDRLPNLDCLRLLDFGCSSGRVLRHFWREMNERAWTLVGVDISARRIEWMRRHFPAKFQVYVGSILPNLPFPSDSLDVVYGFSVFTHIKYLWDSWLLEIRRVLKPGGLLIQTIHCEQAWEYFYTHQNDPSVREALGPMLIGQSVMPDDFVYYGDINSNKVFWKQDVAASFWGRYFPKVEIIPPPAFTYQNCIICQK